MPGKEFRSFATDVRYAETVNALKMPDVIERLATQGGNGCGSGPRKSRR